MYLLANPYKTADDNKLPFTLLPPSLSADAVYSTFHGQQAVTRASSDILSLFIVNLADILGSHGKVVTK